jgi:ABC-type transport system substrate-binding protein
MIEINGEQASATPTTITVIISEYSYTGGAHPNSRQTYLNFNQTTGELIQLEDFITNQELLLNLAEQQFREAYQLASDQDLSAAGLFENQLVLPQNFAITQEGLYLFYNTYEIGPYAAGPYEVNIPWTRLEDILKKDSIIDPDFS